MSGGRAILGIGAGWFEAEHVAFGMEFGRSPGQRLDWLDESVAALRALLDGARVTSPENGHYAMNDAYLLPLPIQERVPIMIGGSGERKTLRTVARYADMWNMAAVKDVDRIRHKVSVLHQRCEEVGRDPSEIEKTVYVAGVVRETVDEAERFFRGQADANRLRAGYTEQPDIHVTSHDRMVETLLTLKAVGFETFIVEVASPFDDETVERFATEIRSQVDAA